MKGVVDLDGLADLKALLPVRQRICGAPVITEFLGGAPAEYPQRCREASPVKMLPLGVRQDFFAGRMFATQAPADQEAAKRADDAITYLCYLKRGTSCLWIPTGTGNPNRSARYGHPCTCENVTKPTLVPLDPIIRGLSPSVEE